MSKPHGHWPRHVVAHYRQTRPDCAICGERIAYDSPRVIGGKINKSSFVIIHKVRPSEAKARSWRLDAINGLANSQAAHRGCASSLGAGVGNRNRAKASAASSTSDPAMTMLNSRW
jgi:hypothetical protein